MAYFDELMQRAITVRNNVAPSSNTALLVGGVLVSIVSALQLLLDTKQGTLTFDDEPTDGSTNPVTSDGIYEAITEALASIDLSACEKIVNKVTAIDEDSTDVQYPTAKLLYDSLQVVDAYLNNLDARVTSLENDPPVTYTIRGTSSNIGGTETFTIQYIAKGATTPAPSQTITVDVDSTGYWEFKYVNKYVYSLFRFAVNSLTLTTCDFSFADDFSKVVSTRLAFSGCSTLTTVNLTNATFAALTDARAMFKDCTSLTTISWALLLNLNNVEQVGGEGSGMFSGCTVLTNTAISALSSQSFAKVAYARELFYGCAALTAIDLSSATFAALIGARSMFDGCSAVTSINLHSATFDELTGSYRMFNNCSAVTVIDMTAATFSKVIDSRQMFFYCAALTGVTLSQTATAIALQVSAAEGSINLRYCVAITYTAINDIAVWLSNRNGYNAQTLTIATSVWNALTAAEQATILGILQAKNWNLATA